LRKTLSYMGRPCTEFKHCIRNNLHWLTLLCAKPGFFIAIARQAVRSLVSCDPNCPPIRLCHCVPRPGSLW